MSTSRSERRLVAADWGAPSERRGESGMWGAWDSGLYGAVWGGGGGGGL